MRALVLAFALLAAPSAFASNATISGPAQAVDGDTIRIDGRSIRIEGVDAFERRQSCGAVACGREAAAFTERFVAGALVVCRQTDTDRYGRAVATCSVGGRDLGKALVRAGWALAYVKYSRAYVGDEAAARAARAGAWATEFTPPWQWRAERRGTS
ncbi:MAG: thermonuclease family protein [Alphaproteobacteria bacterium]|nr:thermonuclease family protein [Alphaproteobacteria bacterium]